MPTYSIDMTEQPIQKCLRTPLILRGQRLLFSVGPFTLLSDHIEDSDQLTDRANTCK